MAEPIANYTSSPAPVRVDARPQTPPPTEPQPREEKVQGVAHSQAAGDGALTAQYTKLDNTKLTVSLDSETGTFIYRSVSAHDGEVVWQWPSEQVMRVIQYFRRIESLEEKLAAKRSVDQKA